MALAPPLRALFNQTVTVAAYASEDAYGSASYGTAASWPARQEAMQRLTRDVQGREVLAQTVVYIAENAAGALPGVTVRDKLTLADGSTPPIISAQQEVDPDGNGHHERVMCG